MSPLLSPFLALGTGAASAFVPIVSAEAYVVVAAGSAGSWLAVAIVLALAAGQTAGKLVLFESARRGSGRLRRWVRHDRARRWSDRITAALGRRRTGHPLVLASAALGLPPLAAVSLAAGASDQRRWEFGVLCLLGRTARFGALALPAAWAWS